MLINSLQLSSVETDIFQNPRPLFPAVDCPVIWERAVCDQHAHMHVDVTLSCLEGASSYLQQEVSYHLEGEKEDSGEDLPDVGAIEAAKESDSGSEEVYGGLKCVCEYLFWSVLSIFVVYRGQSHIQMLGMHKRKDLPGMPKSG